MRETMETGVGTKTEVKLLDMKQKLELQNKVAELIYGKGKHELSAEEQNDFVDKYAAEMAEILKAPEHEDIRQFVRDGKMEEADQMLKNVLER